MEPNTTPSINPSDGAVLSAQSEIDFFWEDFVVGDVRIFGQHRMTEDEILTDFSELTREDIKACLSFAADRERKLFNTAA